MKAGFRKVETTRNVHTTEDLYYMAETELHNLQISKLGLRKGPEGLFYKVQGTCNVNAER